MSSVWLKTFSLILLLVFLRYKPQEKVVETIKILLELYAYALRIER